MDNLYGRRRGGGGGGGGSGVERRAEPRRRRVSHQRICILVTTALTGAALLAVLTSMVIMVNGDKSPDDATIRQVHVVFRHGESTPTDTYPRDPYNDDYYWPEGWGQVTNGGKKQLHDLGVFLKNRYGPGGVRALYDGAFSTAVTKVQSSYADRCLSSAGALLSGMFPPSASPDGVQVWLPGFDWQPVPIRYVDVDEDIGSTPCLTDVEQSILSIIGDETSTPLVDTIDPGSVMIEAKKPCPRYDRDLEAVNDSPEIQKVNQENQDLYNHLTENTGKTMNTVLEVELLYNTLQIEEMRGLKLPDWVKGWYPERMKPLASLSLALFTRTLSMKKTKSGVLLWDMATHMSNIISTPTSKNKIFLYTARDTTIVNVVQGLGIGDDNFKPDFGSAIIVELLESASGDKNVQIFLKNSTTSDELYPLILPSCAQPCQAQDFFKLETITSPDQWDRDCQL